MERKLTFKCAVYSTHSHTPEAPRLRIVAPFTRDVSADEFVAVSRYMAAELGIDMFDECSFIPNQLMYWPTCPSNGEYLCEFFDGEPLDPDAILATHPNWQDCSLLPTTSRESKVSKPSQKPQEDPLAKSGIVGAFCRTYSITAAIEKFLSDIYAPSVSEGRYDYIKGESTAGVVIYDDKFAYSHHATDPACGKLLNAFDLVRIHKFGGDDEKKSFSAMTDFAIKDDAVKAQLASERMEQATESHEGIISPEVFELAQYEFQCRRENGGRQNRNVSPFSEHIICGECGACYGHKVWHSNDKYRRLVWLCNKKYGKGAGDGLRCKTPHLTDDEVKTFFIGAMNAALRNKQEILDSCRTAVEFLTDTSQLESDMRKLEAECDVAAELLRKCIDENAHAAISQEDYETKYAELAARYEAAKGKCENMNEKILQRKLKANRIEAFFKTMETSDIITEFDEGLWNATVDTMTVYSKKKIVLRLKDGTEIEWHI